MEPAQVGTAVNVGLEQTQPAEPEHSADPAGLDNYKRIKTHFPSARVKKLMQSDEDIGKVAQATPVALGRALEMFMGTLVGKAVDTAKQEGTHKINVQILNKTIQDNEQFDFCVGICDKHTKK